MSGYAKAAATTIGSMLELGDLVTVDQCDELQVVAFTFESNQKERFYSIVNWILDRDASIFEGDFSVNLFTPEGLLTYPPEQKEGDDE